jgi:arylsulfatase A-like enzyme
MKRALPLLLLVAVALSLAACKAPTPATRQSLNVILISIDSLRADHVGAYGYGKPTTPAFDAFAASGVLFENSYATSPWTLPSHASMLTGLYPDAHFAYNNDSYLSDNLDLAGERFAAGGYDTHAIVCAPFLREVYNLDQGFRNYDDDIARTGRPDVREIKTSAKVTKKAINYLKRRVADPQPFFLLLHYWDVHYDYNPPDDYAAMFDPDYRGDIDGMHISKRKDIVAGMNPRDLQHLVALYDGEIRYTDDHLAKLLAYLEESGLAKDTAIIITSDHGEEFLEHGSTGHTFTCFEELVRVPLAMRVPGVTQPGARFAQRVENVDLFPTMLAMADLPAAGHKLHGFDLLALIRDGRAPEREAIFCETRMGRRWGWRTENGIWRSLLAADNTKVHVFREPKKKTEVDLFDLAADPGELVDLADNEDMSAAVLAARRRLSQRHRADKALGRKLGARPQSWRKTKRPKAEQDNLDDQLKGLGYMN